MKAKAKKARRFGRGVKKAAYFLVFTSAVCLVSVWLRPYMPAVERYLGRFGTSSIDTAQIDTYYDLLSANAAPGKDLVLDLGVGDKEDLQKAVDRLQSVMGLDGHRIWLAHHDSEKPPAYIKELGYGDMGILISRSVTERREEINLLVHELGHIYVWKLKPSVFGKCDQEKLVDCSGVFLGLGVLMLNGLTDETSLLPGEGYLTTKKTFGYLKPEQFGYLLARYCAEAGINEEAVKKFLKGPGRKYFAAGLRCLRKKGGVGNSPAKASGIYWCPKCGSPILVELSGNSASPRCPRCGA